MILDLRKVISLEICVLRSVGIFKLLEKMKNPRDC